MADHLRALQWGPRKGWNLTLPRTTLRDLKWRPGDAIEIRRVGSHLELRRVKGEGHGG